MTQQRRGDSGKDHSAGRRTSPHGGDRVTQHRGWVIVTRAEPVAGGWAPIWAIRRDRRSPALFTEVLPDRTTSPIEAQGLAHLAALAWLYRSGTLTDRRGR